MIYLGIDPGCNGGIAAIDGDGGDPLILTLKDRTETDIRQWLDEFPGWECRAVVEAVASSPQMGVKSAFTFGRGYGFLRGLLTAYRIPFVEARPQAWQKALGCLTKGDKNVSKARAQQLFPALKVTHATADALLLATYCRRNSAQLF